MIQGQIRSLTSLRLFAAAVVVIGHATYVILKTPLDLPFYQGVTFFFVLSGFILAYNYPELRDAAATRRFWFSRFARLWPATMASAVLVLLCVPEEAVRNFAAIGVLRAAVYGLMIQAWIPKGGWEYILNGVAWSVSAEAFFYFCFPALNKNLDRTWGRKLLLCFCFVLMMGFIVQTFHLPTYSSTGHEVSADSLIYLFPLSRLFEFALGMAAASLWRRGYFRISRSATLVELALVCAIAAQFALGPGYYEGRSPLPDVLSNGFVLWMERSGSALLYAPLIIIFAQERGLISRSLRHPLLVLGGEISFALYLTHQPILRMLTAYKSILDEINPFVLWTAYALIALAIAYCLWAFVETPCRRWLLSLRAPAASEAPKPAVQSS
jgi:peptidoglycan/LPS O-acetylase OafA/YrhL